MLLNQALTGAWSSWAFVKGTNSDRVQSVFFFISFQKYTSISSSLPRGSDLAIFSSTKGKKDYHSPGTNYQIVTLRIPSKDHLSPCPHVAS